MPRHFLSILLTAACCLLGTLNPASAQLTPADTTQVPEEPIGIVSTPQYEEMNISAAEAAGLPNPRKSAFLSTILPGMGQVYNGALWKVPIIYAGGAVFVSVVTFNNLRYSESLKNLMLVQYEPELAASQGLRTEVAYYQRITDAYRRQRDYFIILGTLFYGLQIVEAYVDAHLQTFELDDELSMRIRPTVLPDPTGSMAAGLRITYTFP